MKKRVLNHKNRCEVEQYYKLHIRYDKLIWAESNLINDHVEFIFDKEVSYSEFNRRYKKLLKKCYKKEFRSTTKAKNYDNNHYLQEVGVK